MKNTNLTEATDNTTIHFSEEFLHLNRVNIAELEREYARKYPERAMLDDYYKRLLENDTSLYSEKR